MKVQITKSLLETLCNGCQQAANWVNGPIHKMEWNDAVTSAREIIDATAVATPPAEGETPRFTAADYDKAIADLQCAKHQLIPDGHNCAVCGDIDHQAFECHHNPLVITRRHEAERSAWRCFHCGFVATTEEQAKAHFGSKDDENPSCITALERANQGLASQLPTEDQAVISKATLAKLGRAARSWWGSSNAEYREVLEALGVNRLAGTSKTAAAGGEEGT